MTVLGGARPMPGAVRVLPRGAVAPRAAALPRTAARPLPAGTRRRVSRPERASRRASPVRALIGGILVLFLIGLIYLAQTVHLAATNYEIDQLVAQRDDLYRQVQTVETSVLRWGTEPTVLERAQRLGLDQLPTRIRLTAR